MYMVGIYITFRKENSMAKNQKERIKVEHVYKDFNVYYDKANSIKEKLLFWNRNKKGKREVLKDINLTINNGEAVALIGVNGSGKVYSFKAHD